MTTGRRQRPVGTRRLLLRHLWVLLSLTLLTTLLMYQCYDEVHRDAGAVRQRTAPAVLKAVSASTALTGAHLAALDSLNSPVFDVVGTNEEYRTQVSAAVQNISQIADRRITPADGGRELSTVAALVSAYTQAIDQAVRYAENPALRAAWLSSAETLLSRPETGLLDQLAQLQRAQGDELDERSVLDGERRARWLLTGVALAALLVALSVVQWQLSRRFPPRLNPWLLAAGAVLLGAAGLLGQGMATQNRLDVVREELLTPLVTEARCTGTLVTPTGSAPRVDCPRATPSLAGLRDRTAQYGARVNQELAATTAWARAGFVLPVSGGSALLLVGVGLQRHIRQYRFRS